MTPEVELGDARRVVPMRTGPSAPTSGSSRSYVEGQVERARKRERARQSRRDFLEAAALKAAHALRDRYGEGIAVYLFGSVLERGSFRLESDIDLAVRGLPPDRYYEAWALAEAAVGSASLDLVRLEDAPDWLAEEVRSRGERVL